MRQQNFRNLNQNPFEGIESLDLSVRSLNALRKAKIQTISDLIKLPDRRLALIPGLGKKSLFEILQVIDKLTRGVSGQQSCRNFETISDLLQRFLSSLNSRNAEIFVRRTGLLTGNIETLEAIGDSLRLTRERVRQIEKKTKLRLYRLIRRDFSYLLESVLRIFHKEQLLSLDKLISTQSTVLQNHQGYHPQAIGRLVLEALGKKVHFIPSSENLWTISEKMVSLYPEIIRQARLILSGMRMNLDILTLEVSRKIGLRDPSDLQIVKKCLEASSRFLIKIGCNNEELTPSISISHQRVTSKRRDFAYEYVKRQGVPVNVREIFRAMQEEAPELVPQSCSFASAVHIFKAALARDKRLAWAGLSTFALVEWGYEHEVTSLGQAAERLLRRMGRPMRTTEIKDFLINLYRVSPPSIYAALRCEEGKRFRRVGPGNWDLLN